ncbi:hypothetical protein GGF31_005652 [Allomyces arbusculus]|nr:hypothetical protein GGF31_005652 [Allomyces arbusculus]
MNKLATLFFLLISAVAVAVMLAPAARAAVPIPDKTIYPSLDVFSEPAIPMTVSRDADGSMRLVRKGTTVPDGRTHMFGFRTVGTLPIPAGIKSVTMSVTFAVASAPASPAYMSRNVRIPGTCVIQSTYKELGDYFHLFARRAPTYGDYGSLAKEETFRITVPSRDIGYQIMPTLLKVFHQYQSNYGLSCVVSATVVVKEFKIIFHATEQPMWYGKLMALGDTGRAVDDDDDDGDEDTFDEYGGAYSLVDEAFGEDEYVGYDE